MILLAGIGVEAIFRAIVTQGVSEEMRSVPRLRFGLLYLLAAVLAAGAAHLAWEAYRLNFDSRLVADPRIPMSTPTRRQGCRLAERLDQLGQRMPPGRELTVHVVVKENYWPLPWYLRKFNRNSVLYWLDPVKWESDLGHLPLPDIVILSADVNLPEVVAKMNTYNGQMIDSLRPGIFVRVYVRDELWQKFIAGSEVRLTRSQRRRRTLAVAVGSGLNEALCPGP